MGENQIYELKTSFTEWTQVTKEEWIRTERAAGFRPKLWSGDPAYMTTCATGGFSSSHGIRGRIRHQAPQDGQDGGER